MYGPGLKLGTDSLATLSFLSWQSKINTHMSLSEFGKSTKVFTDSGILLDVATSILLRLLAYWHLEKPLISGFFWFEFCV
jgi:hypothetical protein